MSAQTRGQRVCQLATRRPGALGYVLLPPTWIALGALMVAYVVVILALAFAAVLVATLRLFLTPPVQLLGRLPGIRALVERWRVRRYARAGVAELEARLQTPARARPTPE